MRIIICTNVYTVQFIRVNWHMHKRNVLQLVSHQCIDVTRILHCVSHQLVQRHVSTNTTLQIETRQEVYRLGALHLSALRTN